MTLRDAARDWAARRLSDYLMRRPLSVRVGRRAQVLLPFHDTCYACGTPYGFVKPHATLYGPVDASGRRTLAASPLCEPCWKERTIADRRDVYRVWWRERQRAVAHAFHGIERDEALMRESRYWASLDSALWEGN